MVIATFDEFMVAAINAGIAQFDAAVGRERPQSWDLFVELSALTNFRPIMDETRDALNAFGQIVQDGLEADDYRAAQERFGF